MKVFDNECIMFDVFILLQMERSKVLMSNAHVNTENYTCCTNGEHVTFCFILAVCNDIERFIKPHANKMLRTFYNID